MENKNVELMEMASTAIEESVGTDMVTEMVTSNGIDWKKVGLTGLVVGTAVAAGVFVYKKIKKAKEEKIIVHEKVEPEVTEETEE